MSAFKFLNDFEFSPVSNFWRLNEYDIPSSPGVYLLIARKGFYFNYPTGKNPVYYIGKTDSLRRRLKGHLKYHTQVKDNKRSKKFSLYEPRHEYGAVFGGRYCFIRTWQGVSTKNLEDKVLAQFAKYYHSFPVANSAGAWNQIEKKIKNKSRTEV